MIAATLMLVLAAPPRPGDLDVEYVPVDHPSPAYVEALLRTLGERNPAPAEVDRLASFFLESHSNSFSAVCRLSTSSFWRPRSERILTAANGRRPAPAEIVEFHAELDPTADEAEEIAGLKAQASSPRAVVRGIVTDADDRPVAGALLTGDLGFEPVRTDEQGRYSSRARLKQGEYVTLNVSAEGHAAGGGDTAPWNEHDSLVFDIKLRRPRTVRLTLRDEHKQPIELAAVTLSVKETTLKGVAGPDGVATFTNAPALDEDSSDEANVEILRRGFPAHRQSAKGFVAGSLEITVPPFKPLRGRVLRENGKPAGGAWVQSRNRR
ncbi:MAG TPA: hypothetical protein VNC50_01940, partial [Planctomycetia bacterium]|nr:hypothetical protein [Planctomycetia bacterium]